MVTLKKGGCKLCSHPYLFMWIYHLLPSSAINPIEEAINDVR